MKPDKTDAAIKAELKAEAIKRAPKVTVTPQKLAKILKRAERDESNQ